VGTRSGMCCIGRVVWVHAFCYILFEVNIWYYVSRGYMYMYTWLIKYIQGVPGGMCQTSGECSLC